MSYFTDTVDWHRKFEAVWVEVMASLHSKAEPDGTVHKRADGKILKGSRFLEANIAAVLAGGERVGHAIVLTDDGARVACYETGDADCRTEDGCCLVAEQAEDESTEFAEYYGGPGAHPELVDGLRIDVSWDGECYEWTPATPQAVTA